MYWEYFGFEENPFSISPDPRYLYMSKRHQEALAHLVYGIGEAGGFVLLSGEVGTGKTTICRSVIEQLPDNVDLAFVLNPRLNDVELLATICDEMAVPYPRSDPSLKVLVDRLNEHLLRAHAIGRQPVLLIDEAQNLDPKVLEQIRLLTNLETNKRKLLQIVLIGQPELNELLAQPDLRQLDQRITARYHLRPLTPQETGGYIRHRLQVGGAPTDIFSEAAIRRIFRATGGIPRLINTLCDRCLLGAYAENKHKVDAKLVKSAAKEVITHRKKKSQSYLAPGFFAATATAAAFLLIDPLNMGFPGSTPDTAEPEIRTSDQSHLETTVTEPIAEMARSEESAPPPTDIRNMSAASQTDVAPVSTEVTTPPAVSEHGIAAAPSQSDLASPAPAEDAHVANAAASGTADQFAAVDEGYPLPPPPPMPAQETEVTGRGPWIPISPPSSAPDVIAAFHGSVSTLLDEPIGKTGDGLSEQFGGTANGASTALMPGHALDGSQRDASFLVANTVRTDDRNSRTNGAGTEPHGILVDEEMIAADDVGTEPSSTVQLAEHTLAYSDDVLREPSELVHEQSAVGDLDVATLSGDLETALRGLFKIWGYRYADLKGLSPCKKARYANLRCMQGQATWNELAVANRPAVITLDVGDANYVYALLTQIDGEHATIQLGDGTTVRTQVGALSRRWAGDYLLLWRPPAQFTRELKPGVRGEDVLWLRQRLLSLGWDTRGIADELFYDEGLQEAVRQFQRRRGLTVDGVAGPQTILQVNAALGAANAPTIQ